MVSLKNILLPVDLPEKASQAVFHEAAALAHHFHSVIVMLHVETSSPAEGILEFAKNQHADMIVLGVRFGGSFTRAATHGLRSVTHQIIQSAVCPVLTIRG